MILNFKDKFPKIHESCFIAPDTSIIGDVTLGKDVNVWFGARLRADFAKITVGEGTNVQDNCTLHIGNETQPLNIGKNVTIGHNAVVHGCTIEDNVLIGMGAIILNDSYIGKNTIIGAGALVPQGVKIPEGVLCLGTPAKVIRKLEDNEIEKIKESSKIYINISKEYK